MQAASHDQEDTRLLTCPLCGARVALTPDDALAGRMLRCPLGHPIDVRTVLPGITEITHVYRDLTRAVHRMRRGR